MQQVARNEKSCSKTEKLIGKTLPSTCGKPLREAHYLAAREGNAQSRNTCCLCQKTTKWRTELPEGICVSHSSFIGADFCRRGGGVGGACHFRSSGKQTCKSIWIKQHWIIAWGYWPYVFAGWLSKYSIRWVVSLRGICRNRCLATVPTGKASTCCISFWVSQKDFSQLQERNNLFVDRPVK